MGSFPHQNTIINIGKKNIMFHQLKPQIQTSRPQGEICYYRTINALMLMIAALTLQSCQSSPDSGPLAPVNNNIETYVPPQVSDLIKDTRIRESVPAQTQGGVNSLMVGDEGGTALDLLLIDSSVVYLDSIPTGSKIVSCTLWIKISRLPTRVNDVIILDLWSIPESWNENEASWIKRTSSLAWQIAGGGGALIDSQHVSLKKLNYFDFVWTVRGQMYDTVKVEDGRFLPIPIPVSLASANYNRQSFGFALRVNPATSPAAFMGIISAEASSVANRPYLEWRYR